MTVPLPSPHPGDALVRGSGLADSIAPRVARGFVEHVLRIGRTLFVGAWASLLDFGVLLACMRFLAFSPTAARVIALALSSTVLFIGSRSFAFNASAGSLSRQTKLFIAAELLALPLNLFMFRLLVANVSFVGPAALSQVANFLVFASFAYPVRHFVVFRVPPPVIAPAS